MTTHAIYVLGAPGSGKSTLVRALGDRLGLRYDAFLSERVQWETPVPHVDVGNGWVEVGRDRGAFGGTDALGYTIGARAVAWVTSDQRPANLLGEGDRLASDAFLGALRANYDVFVPIYLEGDPAIAWQRSCDRADALGRNRQNWTWWKGRSTKAANLAARLDAFGIHMRTPITEQVDWVMTALEARRRELLTRNLGLGT